MEKRLIDANALLERMNVVTEDKTCPLHVAAEIEQEIELAPTVDAVEVVHCCDCQNCTAFQQFADSEVLLFCEKWKGHPLVDPTDFCSYGERRDNGNGA